MQLLLVEDDEGIRDSLAEILHLAGFEVATAPDGLEALRWLSLHPGECVMVLDLLMPVMTGLDVLASLQATRPEVIRRTVVVSASPDLLRNVGGYGVAAALTKPFDLGVLTEKVKQAAALR